MKRNTKHFSPSFQLSIVSTTRDSSEPPLELLELPSPPPFPDLDSWISEPPLLLPRALSARLLLLNLHSLLLSPRLLSLRHPRVRIVVCTSCCRYTSCVVSYDVAVIHTSDISRIPLPPGYEIDDSSAPKRVTKAEREEARAKAAEQKKADAAAAKQAQKEAQEKAAEEKKLKAEEANKARIEAKKARAEAIQKDAKPSVSAEERKAQAAEGK